MPVRTQGKQDHGLADFACTSEMTVIRIHAFSTNGNTIYNRHESVKKPKIVFGSIASVDPRAEPIPIHSRTRTANTHSPASTTFPVDQEVFNHAYLSTSAPRTTPSFPEGSATTPCYPSLSHTHKGQLTTDRPPETRIA